MSMPNFSVSGAQHHVGENRRAVANGGGSVVRKKPNRIIGQYLLTKTLGSGSMGKVKLGVHIETGKKVAVKIIPRQSSHVDHGHGQETTISAASSKLSGHETHSSASPAPLDERKEVRIYREAAIMKLLHHPYIVSLQEMYVQPQKFYLIFDYISGGQMLDYIISHGKLKEHHARKFSRQILSAIDYCHRNSIVHRDLKIENILLDDVGNLKIIDFGLANLFSPNSQLNTFCGSLYFAAPELLNARAYIGPEVDIWSFGIILYVLVCGKVPFDDQSMPMLHAKIKRGYVEYPGWLTPECKHLLSRMLVTDPAQRATIPEIVRHPWMLRGYEGPIENYFLVRQPITLPLDGGVLRGMSGFDFGSEEAIKKRLEHIIRHSSLESLTTSPPPHPLVSIYYLVAEHQARTERQRSLSAKAAGNANAAGVVGAPEGLANESVEHQPPKSNDSLVAAAPTGPVEKRGPAVHRWNTTAGTTSATGRTRVAPRRTHASLRQASSTVSSHSRSLSTSEQEQATERKKWSGGLGVLRRLSRAIRGAAGHRGKGSSLAKSENEISVDVISTMSSAPIPEVETLSPVEEEGLDRKSRASKGLARASSARQPRRPGRDQLAEAVAKFPPPLPPPPPPPPHQGQTGVAPVVVPELEGSGGTCGLARAKSLNDHQRSKSHHRHRGRRVERLVADGGRSPLTSPVSSPVGWEHGKEGDDNAAGGRGSSLTADSGVRTVHLKGLFSVATTSTKAPQFIRQDIIRVLNQQHIQWRESKGYFECVERGCGDSGNGEMIGNEDGGTGFESCSINSAGGNEGDQYLVTTHKSTGSGGSCVRFEVMIVRVPWLTKLYGVRFRRVAGHPWKYRHLCSRILADLSL